MKYVQDVKTENRTDLITSTIIGASIEVHHNLSPGLLESVYEVCLAYEFNLKKLKFNRQQLLPIVYKGVILNCDYRIDFLVENKVIVEIKSVKDLAAVHEAQLLSYLKLRGEGLGLLINFNVPLLKDGIRRFKI